MNFKNFNFFLQEAAKSKIKFILLLIFVIVLTLGLSVSLQSILAQWNPACSPPGCNVPPPINTSTSTQEKAGAFYVGTSTLPASIFSARMSAQVVGGLGVSTLGGYFYVSGSSGNVGIGTTNPGNNKLAVVAGPLVTDGLYVSAITGNVGIGTPNPSGVKLDINSLIGGQAIRIVDGTQGAGKVLTSDASGYASWQTAAAGGGLKQINEIRSRGGTWPGFNCATASGDTCQGTGAVGSGTCGQPYRCTQADASAGRVCNDVWGYNGWDAIDTVNCGVNTVQWAGLDATTPWVCTANGAQGAYNSCVGY